MSVALDRHAQLESVSLKKCTGMDAQGMPSYGAPSVIKARVVRKDQVIKLANGESINVNATAWLPEDQAVLPAVDDQVTLADGLVGIVVEVHFPKTIQRGAVDHVRAHIREQ